MLLRSVSSAKLTRQSGTNFYFAFRLLPKEKRHAIYALYSFCRVVDDCVDEEGGDGEAGLAFWLQEARHAFSGSAETDLGRELQAALRRFPMPLSSFEEIVEGCRMDLVPARYRTFEDLEVYCHRVASAVGLAAIEIFGYTSEGTRDYARALGVALQLTNILRDVGADARRGRVYLPLAELERFGVAVEGLLARARGEGGEPGGLRPLLLFQASRAREHLLAAAALLPRADRRSMVPAEVMRATYTALLSELERRDFPLGEKISLSKTLKAALAIRTFLFR